jgi:hypothetical protein
MLHPNKLATTTSALQVQPASTLAFCSLTSRMKNLPKSSSTPVTIQLPAQAAGAGWVVSPTHNIPPKTIRGNWEPIVTTEEFERGLKILEQRDQIQGRKRRHDYLLKGLVYYERPDGEIAKLSCSTPNSSRPSGGTPYYCIPRSNINFSCALMSKLHPNLRK